MNGKLIDPATGLPYRAGGNQDGGGNTVTVAGPLTAGVDRSNTTDAGAKAVAGANASRRGLTLQNTSDTEMRVTENDVVATSSTGYQIAAGGTFKANTTRSISVYCAVAGKTFAATEW